MKVRSDGRDGRDRPEALFAGSGLTVSPGFDYARVSTAAEAAEAGRDAAITYSPEWDGNRPPDQAHAQVHAGAIGGRLVAVDHGRRSVLLRRQARAARADYNRARAQLPAARLRVDAAESDLERVREIAREADLPEPLERTARISGRAMLEVVLIVAFLIPDLFLTAPAFDRFNLSDDPLIGGLGWTDERHVAALGVVLGLLVLAHLLGSRLVVASWRAGVRLRATAAAQPVRGSR